MDGRLSEYVPASITRRRRLSTYAWQPVNGSRRHPEAPFGTASIEHAPQPPSSSPSHFFALSWPDGLHAAGAGFAIVSQAAPHMEQHYEAFLLTAKPAMRHRRWAIDCRNGFAKAECRLGSGRNAKHAKTAVSHPSCRSLEWWQALSRFLEAVSQRTGIAVLRAAPCRASWEEIR